MGAYVSISGGSDASVHIYGDGTVIAGNGNDSIKIDGNGKVTVGSGSDHITLHGSGSIFQHGSGGNDTINISRGADTVSEAGRATVYGYFGSATIQGANVQFQHIGKDGREEQGKHHHSHGGKDSHDDKAGGVSNGIGPSHPYYEAAVTSGNATLLGGAHCTEFVGGSGNVVMQGGTGNDTFIGGSGHTTMTGGSAHNLFAFNSDGKGGTDVITNFVSGQDKLYLEGQTLSYLESQGDVTVSHGNTYISLDGGKTTIELKGFTGLSGHDVTTHK